MSHDPRELASMYSARELADRLAAAWEEGERLRERDRLATRALVEIQRTGRGSWTLDGCRMLARDALAAMRRNGR